MSENLEGHILDEATRQIAAMEPPTLPADLLLQTKSALRAARPERSPSWRMAWTAAVAALILIGAATGSYFLDMTAPVAFAQVASTGMADFRSLTVTLGDGPAPDHIYVKGPLQRYESNDYISIHNFETGESFELLPKQHLAIHGLFRQDSDYDFYGIIHNIGKTVVKPIGQRRIDGILLNGYTGTMAMKRLDIPEDNRIVNIWVDPDTKLPVQIQVLDPQGKVVGVYKDIHFNVEIDDALFAMTPPKGYLYSDQPGIAASQLKAPAQFPNASTIVLRPLIGLGDVKLGDSREQVITLLGPPESESNIGGFDKLEYPSRGIELLFIPKGLQNITVFVAKWVAWNANDFLGSIDRGIRLGSSRADVEAAYGKPDRNMNPDTGDGWYDKFQMEVSYRDDHVIMVDIRRPIVMSHRPASATSPARDN